MNKPLDLAYEKKNGMLYPQLQISKDVKADSTPLGKYGQMCLIYMKDEYPDRYAELRMSGELMPLMHKIDEEAHRQVKKFTNKLMEKEEKTDDTMQKFRLINTCKAEAEEMVLTGFVYQPR